MWAAIIAGVALLISVVLMLIPTKSVKPPQGQIEFPTAQEGISIPVLFGTREFKNPNVVWYGNVEVLAVKGERGKKG